MEASQSINYPPQLQRMLKKALEDPEEFWGKTAEQLHWFRAWDRVFEWDYPFFTWFKGGITNLSYNCVDRHVQRGEGNRAAIIWETGEGPRARVLTYNQLYHEVKRLAAALKASGIERGDRVTIYMPMVPEAAVAMLATTRIGAVHNVVFGGFGYGALADRVEDADSKMILTADIGYRRGRMVELKRVVDEALKEVNNVERVVVLRRGQEAPPMTAGRDIYWEEVLDEGEGIDTEAARMEADELAFILHTSGTTAKPKGTVQPHGSYQVYIYAMGKWVYDLHQKDVWWSTSDIGWIVGHSYVVYAPLLFGCSTIMYEGVPDYPTPDIWWRIVEQNRVTKLWISPTGARALMKHGDKWQKKRDLSSIEAVFCAGEVLNPPVWEWLQKKVFEGRVPVIDHMWQTESSGPMVGNPYGIVTLPIKPGSATIPLPGVDGDVVDDEGESLPVGVKGKFVCRRPFPGLTPSIWRNKERYAEEYWKKIPGCYYTGDAAMKDEDGYIWFLGRVDEVIKISAHRIGTIEIESTLLSHPVVAEAAVVGKPDPLRGEVACAFAVLKKQPTSKEELKQELKQLAKKTLGPIVIIDDIFFVDKLPKTRSGKIMRRLIQAVVTDQPLGDTSTIQDNTAIEEIRRAKRTREK
ncbi:acetate--CoA ligase [Candidatus Bathyarchaeota archaeon]|nr:acetate--CoA ligase [Candidatus Bathyarchaeota archaeon]NIU81725.1 acetate--CoA ligase [Candidatus Bathyarchaeota archaeon]NIV68041.1 acetate--CoA ligase [Candidatus Bathyarchaeota archaeon]NIW16450.1 acetate--CoA ligase [Candidatus Bathyarchaeota archaeon]NIW34570.1 acetate--CoA ligase [Candidatus Bathyarchaeota archaeon]